MPMIRIIVSMIAIVLASCFCANAAVQIDQPQDYLVLDQFFKMAFSSEEYGYVLEGNKPISIRNFSALDHFLVTKNAEYNEQEFKYGLLLRKALPLWDKFCSHQDNFILKARVLKDSRSCAPGLEVVFINVPLLKKVVTKNIDLFRCVLGPTITADQLVKKLAYSEELFMDALHHNPTLAGIVLGFGAYNSLVGGRIESILTHSISRDTPPFIPQSRLMDSKKDHILNFLTAKSYGSYYLELAGGDDSYFQREVPLLKACSGFANLEEELMNLDALDESLPVTLQEKPKFIFGAYQGGPSNQPFFNRLKATQKKIIKLLKSADFLEIVLEKITHQKPLIQCAKSIQGSGCSPYHSGEWVQILQSAARRFEESSEQIAFIDAFSRPSSSLEEPPMVGVSKATLDGLKKALNNLEITRIKFESLSKDPSLIAIKNKKLYYKTTSSGKGLELQGDMRARLGFIMEDFSGNILFANHDSWYQPSQIIPGFAHGIQGMRVGEKRTLFVHPSFAYGGLTTLPPCMGLVIKAHLLDVGTPNPEALPDLTPLDLSWVEDQQFYKDIVVSLQQQPRFIGSFYRSMLDQVAPKEQQELITSLEQQIQKETSR